MYTLLTNSSATATNDAGNAISHARTGCQSARNDQRGGRGWPLPPPTTGSCHQASRQRVTQTQKAALNTGQLKLA